LGFICYLVFVICYLRFSALGTTLLFFDSEEHLQIWNAGHPDEFGESLSLAEALYVGKEFFKDFLS